jgi:hypothetical protein
MHPCYSSGDLPDGGPKKKRKFEESGSKRRKDE